MIGRKVFKYSNKFQFDFIDSFKFTSFNFCLSSFLTNTSNTLLVFLGDGVEDERCSLETANVLGGVLVVGEVGWFYEIFFNLCLIGLPDNWVCFFDLPVILRVLKLCHR